jgi:hypothetical protein
MALVKCPECGNDISSEVRKCPHCGYKKKKVNDKYLNKMKAFLNIVIGNIKKFLIPIIVITAVIVVGITILIIKSNYDKNSLSNYPIVFVENEKLVLSSNNESKKIIVDNKYDTHDNDSLLVAYPHSSSMYFLYMNDGSLYLYNLKSKTKEKIASNLDTPTFLQFSPDDEYVIYSDGSENYYAYELKTKTRERINNNKGEDSTVNIIDIQNKYVLYYSYTYDDETYEEKDQKISIKKLGKNSSSEQISTNVDNYYISKSKTKLAYTVSDKDDTYNLYVYNINKKTKEKIVSNIYEFNYINDLSEFIYTVRSDKKVNILNDDELNKDPQNPVTKTCTYSAYTEGKCTYEDWWDYNTYVDYESKKPVNDEIREYAGNLKTYDVYYQKGNKVERIASGISSLVASNVTQKAVIFGINSYMKKETVKISSLNSLEAFKNYLEESKVTLYYKKSTDDEVKIKDDVTAYVSGTIMDSLNAYISFTDNDLNELYYLDIKNKSNNLSLLDSDLYYDVEANNKLGFIYKANYNDETQLFDLKIANGNKSTVIATDVQFGILDKDTLYMYNNCSDELDCDFSKYENKLTKLTDGVFYAIHFDDKNMYIINNYSESNKTVDLYRLKNGKKESIAFDIPYEYISFNYPIEE